MWKVVLWLFLCPVMFAGSSDSDDETALPIAPAAPQVPRRECPSSTQLNIVHYRIQSPEQVSNHASDRDIEALTIKEKMGQHKMKIALVGLLATTITSTVTLTLYLHDCENK